MPLPYSFWTSLQNALIDLSPDAAIGGTLVATGLALVPAGVLAWRRRAAAGGAATLGAAIFPAVLAALALGLGYERYVIDRLMAGSAAVEPARLRGVRPSGPPAVPPGDMFNGERFYGVNPGRPSSGAFPPAGMRRPGR